MRVPFRLLAHHKLCTTLCRVNGARCASVHLCCIVRTRAHMCLNVFVCVRWRCVQMRTGNSLRATCANGTGRHFFGSQRNSSCHSSYKRGAPVVSGRICVREQASFNGINMPPAGRRHASQHPYNISHHPITKHDDDDDDDGVQSTSE